MVTPTTIQQWMIQSGGNTHIKRQYICGHTNIKTTQNKDRYIYKITQSTIAQPLFIHNNIYFYTNVPILWPFQFSFIIRECGCCFSRVHHAKQ